MTSTQDRTPGTPSEAGPSPGSAPGSGTGTDTGTGIGTGILDPAGYDTSWTKPPLAV